MATVIGLYEDFSSAHHAVRDLLKLKIAPEHISVIASDEDEHASNYLSALKAQDGDVSGDLSAEESAELSTSLGAVIGGVGGILAGLGALVIPVVGPILAVGPITAALGGLAGAGVGALAGGLVNALVEQGVPANSARLYAEKIQDGGALLIVSAPEGKEELVEEAVRKYRPVEAAVHSGEPPAEIKQPAGGALAHKIEEETRDPIEDSPFVQTVSPEEIQPGFLYGFSQAASARFAGKSWENAREELRKEWTGYDYGPWVIYENAVRRGYEQGYRQSVQTFSDMEDVFRQHFETSSHARRVEYDHYRNSYRFGWEQALQSTGESTQWEDVHDSLKEEWQDRYGDSWDHHQNAVRFAWEQRRSGTPRARAISPQTSKGNGQIDPKGINAGKHEGDLPAEVAETAYQFGTECARHPAFKAYDWDQLEEHARLEWEHQHNLDWEQARVFVHDAWEQARHRSEGESTDESGSNSKEQVDE